MLQGCKQFKAKLGMTDSKLEIVSKDHRKLMRVEAIGYESY